MSTVSPPRDEQGRYVEYVTDEAENIDLHIPHPRTVPIHHPEGMSPIQALGTLLATGAIAFGCVAVGARALDDVAPVDPDVTISQAEIVSQEVSGLQAMQATPAPTTVQGYRKMFDQVPVSEWGGADVSISVKMPDGRIVWLYADTLSANNGFVHSTAITQEGGNLHVSNGGQQLLPDDEPSADGRERIYWIETATVIGHDTIMVKAQRTSIGKESVWDFHRDGEKSRAAIIKVEPNGDVAFQKWIGWTKAPDLPDDFVILGPNHFKYQPVVHEHIRLDDGGYLKTWSQNWDNDFADHANPDGSLAFKDWRPMFSSTRVADSPTDAGTSSP